MERNRTERHVDHAAVERVRGEAAAEYLRRLEASGQYLFHGSPDEIAVLEPRDPVTDATDDPENKRTAVYAYSSAALGVQRAIVDRRNVEGDWDIAGGTDPDDPSAPLLVTTSNLPLGNGYVHVLPRGSFRHTGGYQWVSESRVAPVATVKVDPETYAKLGGTHKRLG